MATAAIALGTWLDPPQQQYFSPQTVNWHASLVDPVTRLAVTIPAGGALAFQWSLPAFGATPTVVSPVVNDGVGLYHVNLPLTTAMYGKLILEALLTDATAVLIDTSTLLVVVYGTGQ